MKAQLKLGFMGLGIMGSSMARNLARASHKVLVYNRSPEKSAALKEEGLEIAATPRELAENCSLIFSCVTNALALGDLLFGTNGVCKARHLPELVVDLSTIAPSDAIEISQKLKEHRIDFLDAPVTGGDVGARNATLTIMVGGEESRYREALPYLECIGKKIFHMGVTGRGQLAKCVNQIGVALSISAMTEALSFAKCSGLDVSQTLEVIRSGAAGSWALDNYAPRLLKEDFKPGFRAEDMLKDLRFALAEADSLNLSLPVCHIIKEQFLTLANIFGGAEIGNHALGLLYDHLKGAKSAS